MLNIHLTPSGARSDLSLESAAARPARQPARLARERLAGPGDAVAPGEVHIKPAPARRSVTARAVRSDMLLVLLAALAALAAGGALGCGHACNHGFSPCPAVSSAPPASSAPSAKGRCPTEYRPLCPGGDTRCVADRNGCQVCDCVDHGAPPAPMHPRDVQEPRGVQ